MFAAHIWFFLVIAKVIRVWALSLVQKCKGYAPYNQNGISRSLCLIMATIHVNFPFSLFTGIA